MASFSHVLPGLWMMVTVAMHSRLVIKLLAKQLKAAAAGSKGTEHRGEQSSIQMVYGVRLPRVL